MPPLKTSIGAQSIFLLTALILIIQASPAAAFGAGNIASISKIEGRNWRHGDIEDMLKTIAFIKGHKWTSMMVRRVYFGNWLRDYSQAVDVGTLKGIQSGTIRILVWVLSFLSFGYATGEFEVTEERLGVYRPEEHIDNPKDYADNADARQYDQRLRPPVQPIELQVELETGMKNYIANERLGIATSVGYVKFSFMRSIHFGRVYTNGAGASRAKEADLCEALRCLGQGLHCLEDFGAHTNYTELALREMGFTNVFPHTGTATEISLRGRRVFPLVTGTFGAVDFLHSVLGEATDHFAQTEIDQMDIALGDAQMQSKPSGGKKSGGLGGGETQLSSMTNLLSQVPGAGNLCQQAEYLQAQSDAQEQANAHNRASLPGPPPGYGPNPHFAAPPGAQGGPPGPGVPGMSASFDPVKTASQIYPILEFRDKVVKAISATIEKIPGLEALVEKITERLTLFVLSLLAPFIRPIINAVSAQLKAGSSTVVDASGKHQYEPWTDPHCSDPTHSLLSKDHFSNILNEPAGKVASTILQYVAPRILYAWQNPDVPVDQVLNDISRVFHHPAARDHNCELHMNMYDTVQRWAHSQTKYNLNSILSSESVRAGKNHVGSDSAPEQGHSHGGGGLPIVGNIFGSGGTSSHSKVAGAPWEKLTSSFRDAPSADGGPPPYQTPGSFPGSYEQQQQQENQYVQHPSPYPPQQQQQPGFGGGGGPPPPPPQSDWQPGYQQNLHAHGGYGPQSGYPPQQGYGYDPNAPPGQQYGGGPPPPPPPPPHQQGQGGYHGGGGWS
ncbi:MAG: hypothetical protein LQ342_004959 [Letrouitia transgressa]|nr:MAG: hypothetical protein LQ342_004959 [Letrouitia transgressa]